MTRRGRSKKINALLLFLVSSVLSLRAQTFTTLANFDGSNGGIPDFMSLVQGRDGNLYGTTLEGGDYNSGTVFEITRGGTFSTLHSFRGGDGYQPNEGLLLGADGNFYGTAILGGGVANCGTVFKITSTGQFTTLHQFDSIHGCAPAGALMQATDGYFYGTTEGGGPQGIGGTIFRIDSAGQFAMIYSFCITGYCPDASYPTTSLVQNDGDFYGTTFYGGINNAGTVFKVSPRGVLTILHRFDGGRDGSYPLSGLLLGSDGNFYGATLSGGNADCDPPYGCGTVFKISRKGRVTTLYRFSFTDGAQPTGSLVQATDGNIYGTTEIGGVNQYGTIFEVKTDGTLETLHNFDDGKDGGVPRGGLTQATGGIFYGTTSFGGNDGCDGGDGCGTVFSLDTGLSSFVAFLRDSGKIGTNGGILGQGLTGTTEVSLNGTPADFRVVSDTFLKATVPPGATTGIVTVTTPSGILQSNIPFRVLPQLLSFDPPSGPPGTQVTITGMSLTQTLGVGFGDRVQSQFTVNSDTSVTATVPQGAKTGKIGIETKGGVAISSGMFEVTTK